MLAENHNITAAYARLITLVLMSLMASRALGDAAPAPDASGAPISEAANLAPAAVNFTNASVASIDIVNENIFDLSRQDEDKFLFRLANKLHIRTRPVVIENQLLFQEGDRLTKSSIDETERILRSNRYLQDANIDSIQRPDGKVDLTVTTVDSWTLMPKFSISRSGGENSGSIGLKELNLLGTGIEVEAGLKSDVDRDRVFLKYKDRNLFDSWYSLQMEFADNSDGRTQYLALALPFYSLDSRKSQGISMLDIDQVDSHYESGDIVSRYRHEARTIDLFRGWSKGLQQGWTTRFTAGLAYDEHRFSEALDEISPSPIIPEDRLLAYPYIGIERVEDAYETVRNVDHISRTEDRFLGTRLNARIGYASTGLGSDRNAWIVHAGAQTGFGSSTSKSLTLIGAVDTRLEEAGAQNLTLRFGGRYFSRQSDRRLFYASISGLYGHNLDIENQVLLGGDNGLRGYPLRYSNGDRAALLTMEQRYFSDWYPFRLFRVGGAVFFDAGRTWDSSLKSKSTGGWLRDIGFGLRLANTRSGQGHVTHIDIAFPLDGDQSIDSVQFLIETKKSF